MTDTITADEYRTAARVIAASQRCAGFPYATGAGVKWLNDEAARLEAESARDEEAVQALAKILGDFAVADEHSGVRDDMQLARLLVARGVRVADGRLLPEGGVAPVLAKSEFPHPYHVWEQGYMTSLEDVQGGADGSPDHPFTSNPYSLGEPVPAESVPDGGSDGTPEKPWPNLRAVPTTVREVRSASGFHWERRSDTMWKGCDEHSYNGDCSAGHPEYAPFVRVGGDKA